MSRTGGSWPRSSTSAPRTAWWPATGRTSGTPTRSGRCCSACTPTTASWPASAWSARSRCSGAGSCSRSCSRWSPGSRGTRGTGRNTWRASAPRGRPWPAGGTRPRTCRSFRCGRSGWSRSATTTWRARGSGTPPSSSAGARTVIRARAAMPSWRSRSASTSARSSGAAVPDRQVLAVAGREVVVTNPGKVFFPRTGHTKLDLVRYYLSVAAGALGGVGGRPMALKRFVQGAEGEAFFQKRAPRQRPDWIRTAEEIVVSDAAQLAWVINLGCIDLNPHPVRARDLDHPDELRVDLDPVPGVQWPQIRDVAMVARSVLSDYGLTGWPKTSGSRGFHIYARIVPRWTFGEVRRAAVALAREIERRAPEQATSRWWKEERHGVFVDYNQNAKDRTVASAYSVLPVPDARVSAPLSWDEVPSCDPGAFTIDTVPARFAAIGDPWAAMDDAAGSLDGLLELAARDEAAGLPDAPWPPHYEKQVGEAPRVQPSKRRADAAGARGAAAAPAPGKASGPTGRRRSTMPLIEVARAATRDEAMAGLERWKARHPAVWPRLEPADVLVDAMRGRSSVWYRIRLNLRHVPAAERPPQEPLEVDYDPWSGFRPLRPPWRLTAGPGRCLVMGERCGLGPRVVLVDPPPVGQPGAGAVVAGAVAPRAELDARGPAAPQPLVGGKRPRDPGRARAGAEQRRQRHGVLEGLVDALAQVRKHRVRRVAEQRQPPVAPPGQRRAVVQSPAEPAAARPADRCDDLADERIPAREVRGQRGRVAGRRPRLAHRRRRRHESHVVQQPPGPHREHQEVPALAHPHPHRAGRVLVQARHQAAVGHHPGEHRLRRLHHEPLQHGVDAVRPDHHVCGGRGAVGEDDRGAAAVLAEAGAPVAGPHRAGRQPGRE